VRLFPWRKDGTSELVVQRRAIAPLGLPDPWLGKPCSLSIDTGSGAVLYFAGDVVTLDPPFEDAEGWTYNYHCLGLRWRGDLVPFTDEVTLTDTSAYNLDPADPAYLSARAGRTAGQILTAVLTMATNATRLDAQGIGGYTSLAPPTLPAATVADLAALTIIPPFPCYLGGEKLFNALQGFLGSVAPNHTLWIQPDGVIRFLDTRSFAAQGLTLGIDPVEPPTLRRSVATSFPRVVVRGQPLVEPVIVQTLDGTLAEYFDHDGLTNAAAITAWTYQDFLRTLTGSDFGSCSCPSTTTVTVTSADPTAHWPSNYWDQTGAGAHGVAYLTYSIGTDIHQVTSRRIVSNTALVAAGSSTLTLESALPITSYDSYTIYGQQAAASLVWRRYKIPNNDIGHALASQFTFPVPWRFSDGSAATLSSAPTSVVMWNPSGSAPWFEATAGFTQDPTGTPGTITFNRPVTELTEPDQNKLLAGSGYQVPYNVRVLLAVNKGVLTSTQPADIAGVPQYTGTSNTVEGRTNTLYVMVPAWRDPGNQAAMDDYCAHLLDSVKDTVVEGSVVYYGLFEAALTPGVALSIAGDGYTTGWESLALPIYETELSFPQSGPHLYITRMMCSNRRAQYTGELFVRPSRTGITIGLGEGDQVMSLGAADAQAALGQAQGAGQEATAQAQAQQAALDPGPLPMTKSMLDSLGASNVGKDASADVTTAGLAGAQGAAAAGIQQATGSLDAGLSAAQGAGGSLGEFGIPDL
jgi:hypothetical protein